MAGEWESFIYSSRVCAICRNVSNYELTIGGKVSVIVSEIDVRMKNYVKSITMTCHEGHTHPFVSGYIV